MADDRDCLEVPVGGVVPLKPTTEPVIEVGDSAPLERTDRRTLEMLVCPVSKMVLEYDAAKRELISRRANLAYPIRSGVPLLTREAARSLDR